MVIVFCLFSMLPSMRSDWTMITGTVMSSLLASHVLIFTL